MADEKILPRDLPENTQPSILSLVILDDGTNVFSSSISDIGDQIGAIRTIQAGTGISVDGTNQLSPSVSLSNSTQNSLALANSSVQPTLSISAGEGLSGGGNLSQSREIALSSSSIASLSRADTSIQPSDIGS